MEVLEKLKSISFAFFVLHVADEKQYAKIPVTEEYLKMIDAIVDYRKPNGEYFVNFINAQGEVDCRVNKIIEGKRTVLISLQDRAGLLEGEGLCKKRNLKGKLYCSMYGTEFEQNVLLPDGSVTLCCNDFGMKHVLGNLVRQSFEEIRNSEELEKIKVGMAGDLDRDILCRNCSCANVYSN